MLGNQSNKASVFATLCSTWRWTTDRGFNKCADESMEKLEQGKRLESWVGGREAFPVEYFQGMLLIAVQYCLNENFASHLSDWNRWASHESLDYFYHLDTVSHVADCISLSSLLLLSLYSVLDINKYLRFWPLSWFYLTSLSWRSQSSWQPNHEYGAKDHSHI